MTIEVRDEDRAEYRAAPQSADDAVVEQALRIIEARMRQGGPALSSPNHVGEYFRLRISHLEHEAFWVVLLDAQNRAIHMEELFRGTLTQTPVFPREVVKLALKHNAAGALFAHNHPSGTLDPSNSDVRLTETLKKALALIDVRVLDHFIVSPAGHLSFAERGLL